MVLLQKRELFVFGVLSAASCLLSEEQPTREQSRQESFYRYLSLLPADAPLSIRGRVLRDDVEVFEVVLVDAVTPLVRAVCAQ